jgi:hypothetical protein
VTFRRILVIVALGALVGAGWAAIGHSAWAAGLDAGTAGSQFSHAIEPLRMISGWLLVAVPSVLLIRTGWAWFDARVLGHEPRRRIDPSTRVVRGE